MASWIQKLVALTTLGTSAATACAPEPAPVVDETEKPDRPGPGGGSDSPSGDGGTSSTGGKPSSSGGRKGAGGASAGGEAGILEDGGVVGEFEGREYRLYTPSGLAAGEQAPLAVVLHGAFGSATWIENNLGLDAEAERGGFRVAYLNGTSTALGEEIRVWNAGGNCCGIAARENIDDVTYVKDFLALLEQRGEADAAHTAIVGQSNGGALAWRMACEAPETAAAFVSISGTLMVDSCSASAGKSFLHIHGENDQNILFSGGSGPEGDPTINWRSVPDSQNLLRDAGVSVDVVQISGAAHSLESFDNAGENLAKRIADFVMEHTKGTARNGGELGINLSAPDNHIDPADTSGFTREASRKISG